MHSGGAGNLSHSQHPAGVPLLRLKLRAARALGAANELWRVLRARPHDAQSGLFTPPVMPHARRSRLRSTPGSRWPHHRRRWGDQNILLIIPFKKRHAYILNFSDSKSKYQNFSSNLSDKTEISSKSKLLTRISMMLRHILFIWPNVWSPKNEFFELMYFFFMSI